VLALLFMKYVTDKYKGNPCNMIVVTTGVNFEDMVDRLFNLDGIFEGFDLSANRTDEDELLSDALRMSDEPLRDGIR